MMLQQNSDIDYPVISADLPFESAATGADRPATPRRLIRPFAFPGLPLSRADARLAPEQGQPMRKILSVVLGAGAAMLVVAAFDALASYLYPLPVLESGDPDALAAVVAGNAADGQMARRRWLAGRPVGRCLARVADQRTGARPGGSSRRWSLRAASPTSRCCPIRCGCSFVPSCCRCWAARAGIWLHRKPYPGEPLLG